MHCNKLGLKLNNPRLSGEAVPSGAVYLQLGKKEQRHSGDRPLGTHVMDTKRGPTNLHKFSKLWATSDWLMRWTWRPGSHNPNNNVNEISLGTLDGNIGHGHLSIPLDSEKPIELDLCSLPERLHCNEKCNDKFASQSVFSFMSWLCNVCLNANE